MKPHFHHNAYRVQHDHGVESVSLEDVYQLFKARMAAEAKEAEAAEDFPLGPACDLSGEGGCESCS